MSHNRIVPENQLDEWVRFNSREAQGIIVELVSRLVAASVPRPKDRRFPLGDSIGQHGPDGILITDSGFEPFVPQGKSFWEIGTGTKAASKATSDYRELTAATPEAVRRESTFVFVTPLSGRRDWEYSWKKDAQAAWLEKRRQQNDWRGVLVVDGSRLIDWIQHFPAVECWLAKKMDLPAQQIQIPEQRWAELKTIGDPPTLPPQVFLVNRSAACERLREVFSGTTLQLKLDTHFPDQVADFVSAYLSVMDYDARVDALNRYLIVSGAEGFDAILNLQEPHILIADFHLDEADSLGMNLLQKAQSAGHSVIFGGLPGGIPHKNRVSIPNPRIHQIKEELEKAGYNAERARVLAQKSDGNLSSLLRCLRNLPLKPEWAQGPNTNDLAVAMLLGAWEDNCEADRTVVEKLTGQSYGTWISKMREVSLRQGTPLTCRNGVWKFISRYEGWYALGPGIFDEHLDGLKEAAIDILRERDPQFELPPEERYAAGIHDKVLTHSRFLRNGLAESLALLGSHPKALVSCTLGKAEVTTVLAVQKIFDNTDWVNWASIDNLLPLLAEAAPGEFLDAVEKALNDDPCPFDALFGQERSGILGRNNMTGLLWALETLAWDPQHLTRVVVSLGGLALRDPGGNWANRPSNSLSTIFLPWLPQTCAPVSKRHSAIETLLNETPDVGWKLLLSLLPSSHQASMGTQRPAWREFIPDDWPTGVSHFEYWEQITGYSDLAIRMAKGNLPRLADLISRLDELLPPAHEQLLAYLGSSEVVSKPEPDRLPLWAKLIELVTKHRKFADAKWAMGKERVGKIAALSDKLAPNAPDLRFRRLFTDRDHELFETKGGYEEQRKDLERRRQKAIREILAAGSVQGVLEFAQAVESPSRVGIAFGAVAENDADSEVLPGLLDTNDDSLKQFAAGFVWGRFNSRGWTWVDEIDFSRWPPSQTGQFLACLPFKAETWERSTRLLGDDDSLYWTRTSANPYEADKGVEFAVDRLIKHGRPRAAIRCLDRMHHEKQPLNNAQVVRALLEGVTSSEGVYALDADHITGLIKALQDDPNTEPDHLFRVEWAYLQLLDHRRETYPKFLEERLANDPGFFCEVIRKVFRSKRTEPSAEEPTEQQKSIARNAYHLLREWRTPPGSQTDGAFDGDSFTTWIKEMKKECEKSGHLEAALLMVGHVLTYSPSDPDGLWIHHATAAALNADDAKRMREGFVTELFNSRGTHSFTAGQEERQLAENYRKQAEEVDSHGYHRVATSLRKLAASYERDAERQASMDPFDD